MFVRSVSSDDLLMHSMPEFTAKAAKPVVLLQSLIRFGVKE